MKLFRLRFILLGLLLCVCHVWCLTCGTEFDDTASSAYIADIVIIGTVSQRLPPVNNKLNATVIIKNKRNVLKGDQFIKRANRQRSGLFTLGEFGDDNPERCIASVQQDTQYIFFLNATSDRNYFVLSALPVSEKLKKEFKRGKKDIKKIVCSNKRCVKIPVTDTRRQMKDTEIALGKTLQLNCRLKTRTLPSASYTWYKDDQEITKSNTKGLSIRNGAKGSRLQIRKAGLSVAGKYECVAKNVGGSIKQQAVITISGVSRPEVPKRIMKNKEQKYGGTLKLTCKIKGGAMPKPQFTWYKDGHEIRTDTRKGLTVKDRGNESRLRKKNALRSDGGKYTCIARNAGGEAIQTSEITIIDAPVKQVPCGPEDVGYCLNGGTCAVMVEIDYKFCSCPQSYSGKRCDLFVVEVKKIQDGEAKLAQDRNLIIVGIISGILLFIGICVASYFLAKRRRERFYRRRRQRATIEDNIPQVYRQLIGCDDVDGLKKQINGRVINKETQTIETCFLGSDTANLYINPLEGYIRPDRDDRNSRSRKTAVSLEGYPGPGNKAYNGDPRRCKSDSSENNNDNPKIKANNNKNSRNNFESDGAPNEGMNDLSNEKLWHAANDCNYARPIGVVPKENQPNIPSVSSPNSSHPQAFNLDTDSDDDILSDGTPLTPLHISEDEDNNEIKRSNEANRNSVASIDNHRKPSGKPNTKGNNRPPDYNVAIKDYDKYSYPPNDKMYASSSSDSSDSSSTTEGCDSPNTALQNAQSFSDPALDKAGNWNERGSPEVASKPQPFFQFPASNVKPSVYANRYEKPRYNTGSINEHDRQQRWRDVNRDRKPFAL